MTSTYKQERKTKEERKREREEGMQGGREGERNLEENRENHRGQKKKKNTIIHILVDNDSVNKVRTEFYVQELSKNKKPPEIKKEKRKRKMTKE